MVKLKWLVLFAFLACFAGCGPDTIFVRPGLDTPAQHVSNGYQLLDRGKVNDACREFIRARDLDPRFIQAYIGLGIALGHKGEFEAAMRTMEQARIMADSGAEMEVVQKGYKQLEALRPIEN